MKTKKGKRHPLKIRNATANKLRHRTDRFYTRGKP